ncbi:MAG: adenylosuccinate lyase [Bacteroidia bacterium]|nr:adenylosuccinate lyase [Bacteroidia bacterium]
MSSNPLLAVSPIDGRYQSKVGELSEYFSEYALIKYRVRVEVEYFISLCELKLPQLKIIGTTKYQKLRDIYKNFTINDAKKVKDIEKVTNHDVKAVEYFLKKEFDKIGLEKYKEFIHFGLTSQDINNTAVPLSLRECIEDVYLPLINDLTKTLGKLANSWKDISMLARTHGQPASPTKLGKEIMVFIQRINNQLDLLNQIPYSAKFGGATGNFNAHYVAYPDVSWHKFANQFVSDKLGLERSDPTTQIEHYDNIAATCDNLKRINNILIDFCRDSWTYISMEYFKQKINKNEVGSSAMPHKVNPIDFENAEGNFGVANALFEHLSSKLPISRLQRDLTDSTVLRNIGVPIAHTVIAIKSTSKGIGKLIVNKEVIQADLNSNWAVVSEAIQTVLRRESYPKPYEALKGLTRSNNGITKENMHSFIDTLKISDKVKKELKTITPENYTGK